MTYKHLGLFLALVQFATATSASGGDGTALPTIVLDNGTFVGTSEGDVSIFRSIPYAKPPVGDLRFRLPIANDPYTGTFNATTFGAACIQQVANLTDTSNLNPIAAQVLLEATGNFFSPDVDDEDCLTLDVYIPANATQDSKFPVAFWMFGGGFQTGASSGYNGTELVIRSQQLGEPVIYIAVNYRLSALGFAGSAEVREAGIGNLGLQDQRMALHWIQKYIGAIGGDPSKVTIWGQSAGSISAAMQMLANDGDSEGLFSSAFMQSGGPISMSTGTVEDGQVYFDKFATDAGCGESLGSAAVFDCLRNASIADIRSAVTASQNIFDYASLDLAWQPRADGTFLTENAQVLVQKGSMADVPFVIGDDDDEGTIFSLVNSNITTEAELRQYLQDYYFPLVNTSTIDTILANYPDNVTLGSPFDTGSNNSITPEYKRISAIFGDYVFQVPRRFLLTERLGNANAYSFLYKRGKETPVIGASHGSDFSIFEPGDLMDALIHFVNKFDPNGASLIDWPAYTAQTPVLFTLLDGDTAQEITNDTYRLEGMQAIQQATNAGIY
ncbi:unnamed protein product [Peniophora sp. CBMAI 1063]|nr:unnamed protein product [Peniophora sp. CBMAI 1063]